MIKNNNQGFTLAELLVVIAIMGLLTAVVLVNLQKGEYTNDLRQAGTELLQNIRLAQNYTIGGSSLNYCDDNSDDKEGIYCPSVGAQTGCDGTNSIGYCKNGVPLGGYGVHFASTENYIVFADTNRAQTLGTPDRQIIFKDISLSGIHIKSFKLGAQAAEIPSANNYLSILFEPPAGIVHFYVELDTNPGVIVDDTATTASIIVQSNFVSGYCKKITVNRVSGQISEQQSECNQ